MFSEARINEKSISYTIYDLYILFQIYELLLINKLSIKNL
jgi:hypothetical protein